jgi:heme/copper-type cytochrome/quinol oxidase subunit 2
MVAIFLFLLLLNYLFVYKTGRNVEIVKEKPKFWRNNKLSVIITAIFFLVTTSLLFIGPILGRGIMENHCGTVANTLVIDFLWFLFKQIAAY